MAKKQIKHNTNELAEMVRKMEQDYISGTPTKIGKYVEYDQYETIEKEYAYLNSRHITGDKDSMGRDKPFFNVVVAVRNLWHRATDIDRKHIRIKGRKLRQRIAAFVANLHVQDGMRRNNFGAFLNKWGLTMAGHGSAISKHVEKDGEMISTVVPWNRIICDPVNFADNPKIEVLWLTASQLRANKAYDQKLVEKLIETKEARETLDGQDKDTKSDYYQVYEVHGQLPLSYLTGKDTDDDDYVQQMQVMSFVASKEKGKWDDFILYKGKEAKDPYQIDHLIEEEGRTKSIGAVEYLFDAQWMANHTIKAMKDQLDLASKLIFQTSDSNFVGQNALSAIETGDILVHALNQPLTKINNDATDITSLTSFGQQWRLLEREITSTPDAMMGGNQPAGTAWRQVEALRQEGHSLFKLMTQNKAHGLERMMREFYIPFYKKKMDTPDELALTLDMEGITEFDAMFVPQEAIKIRNRAIIDASLNEQVAPNIDPLQVEQEVQKNFSSLGNQRYIKPSDLEAKTWKEVLKDLEWDVEVDASNEASDSDSIVTTLTTVLQTIATNPNILLDPNMKMVFNRILEETGALSPLAISNASAQKMQQTPTVGGSNAPLPLTELAQQ